MMEARFDRLPERMQEPARAYVEDHRRVGGFLSAVLSNDLVGAFGFADPENLAAMRDWTLWLWNDIPSECWGSRAKVEAWLDQGPTTERVYRRIEDAMKAAQP